MNDNGNTNLAAAIAAVQASLPHIGKNATNPHFKSKYADLAEVSHAVLPVLGKHGLAFISKPTVQDDGQFVLAYSLLHVSGEREDGTYLLPAQGTPQQIGSAITYARRYCLCAVTGAAPASDDDDGAAANTSQQYARPQSAGAAFENARPVRNGRRSINAEDVPPPDDAVRGTVSRPAGRETPAAATEADPDAQRMADLASKCITLPDLERIFKQAKAGGKLAVHIKDPDSGATGGLGGYLNYLKRAIEEADALRNGNGNVPAGAPA